MVTLGRYGIVKIVKLVAEDVYLFIVVLCVKHISRGFYIQGVNHKYVICTVTKKDNQIICVYIVKSTMGATISKKTWGYTLHQPHLPFPHNSHLAREMRLTPTAAEQYVATLNSMEQDNAVKWQVDLWTRPDVYLFHRDEQPQGIWTW